MAQELTVNKWRWGRDAFIFPEELGFVIPSYFDAPIEDLKNVQPGVIKSDALKYTGDKAVFSVKGGSYSAGGYERINWPSEALSKVANVASIYVDLPSYPSLNFLPEVSTFSVNQDNVIVPERRWVYSPGNLFESSADKFKVESRPDGFRIELASVPQKNYSRVTVKQSGILGTGEKIFVLSEFPVANVVTGDLGDGTTTIDHMHGIIYTTASATSISVSFDAVPLVTFLPEDAVSEDKIFHEASIENEKFSSISVEPDFRL